MTHNRDSILANYASGYVWLWLVSVSVSAVTVDCSVDICVFCIAGTCINNTSVFMFKKGCFELGATIYPVVIKVKIIILYFNHLTSTIKCYPNIFTKPLKRRVFVLWGQVSVSPLVKKFVRRPLVYD